MIIANILYWILLGFLAGVIASVIMRRAYQKNELILNMGVGMAGALIGGAIHAFLIDPYYAYNSTSYPPTFASFAASLGATVLLLLVNLIRNSNRKAKENQGTSKPETIAANPESIQTKIETPVPLEQAERKTPPPEEKPQAATDHESVRPADKVLSRVIFISYRRSDTAHVAGRIYDRLVDGFGRPSVFKDVDSIPLGLDFKEYLDEKVGECDVLLAIIGEKWLEASDSSGKRRLDDPTDFVRIEIESALVRKIPVIPLLVDGAAMPPEGELPDTLKKLVYRNGIKIRHDPDFHRDMDRLMSALKPYV